MNYYIIVFKNTHDAMTAEKKLEESEFNFRIMPTPTTITQSCGICVRLEEKESLNRIVEENIVEYKSIYEKNINGYNLL